MAASEVGPSGRPPMANELYAAGRLIGNKCFDENLSFMQCKKSKGDAPTACLPQGEAVHTCVYALYKDISAKAAKEFKDYAACLDSYDLAVPTCKKYQNAFESAYYSAS